MTEGLKNIGISAKTLNYYPNYLGYKSDYVFNRRLEVISNYIPSCIVDYELAEYVREYHSKVNYTTVAIDLKKYNFIKETHNKKLLIVHAPTSPEIKGTTYILSQY